MEAVNTRQRVLYIGLAMFSSAVALALFFAFVHLSEPASHLSALTAPANASDEGPAAILARRAISIPFGIDDQLFLGMDGENVQVTGHGSCPEGGETYQIKVKVLHESSHVLAKGQTEGACPGTEAFQWSATAATAGPRSLTTGNAEACAVAMVSTESARREVFHWCKQITLK